MKQPSPQIWEDKWIPTTCGSCYAMCAIRVRVINGVPVQIEGEPESAQGPVGGVCGKALSQLHMHDDPYRVNYPLRRTNPKKGVGEDPNWKRITWEEAMDEIVEKFSKLHKEDPTSIGLMGSPTTGYDPGAVVATMGTAVFGGAMVMSHTAICGNATHEIAGMNHCSWSVTPDFQYCNYAIFFGAGKGVGAGHSMAMIARLRADATARGLKTVAFDPACHQQGGKSTEWVPILPGTDLTVALSMANLLVNELGIYDREYLKTNTNASYLVKGDGKYVRDERGEPTLWDVGVGKAKPWDDPSLGDTPLEGEYQAFGETCRPVFSILKEHLKQYTPEWASGISTVPAATIRRIAREYGENARIGSTIVIDGVTLPYRPVACAMFRGGTGHSNGFQTYMAIDILNHLVGNAEVPGGCIGWVARSFGYPETGMPNFAPKASKDGFLASAAWMPGLPSIWPHPRPQLANKSSFTSIFSMALADCLMLSPLAEETYNKLGITSRLKAFLIEGANPVMNNLDPESTARALGKIPFIVHYQIYCNETSEGFADIVLPDTGPLESFDILNSELYHFHHPIGMGPMEYHIRQPVVPALYERRTLKEFFMELADRMGLRKECNRAFNIGPTKTGCPAPLDPEKKYTWEEVCDRFLATKFGPEHNLEWFKEHGFLRWPKKPEEAYWRPFINARSCIYMEFLIEQAEDLKAILEPRGINIDLKQYTPLISYFPSAPHKRSC